MPSPIIPSKDLAINAEAHVFHDAGLQAQLASDFAGARRLLAGALTMLGSVETLDATVQQARITRDAGFTDIREALSTGDPESLTDGQEHFNRSVELTGPAVAGMAFLPIERTGPHDTPKRPRRELLAEHGATVSLVGRAATVRQVMTGEDAGLEKQAYGLAHDTLRLGNNGYYRVSNAMVGARQERIDGRVPHTAVWLARAAFGVAWTAARDRGNLKATAMTAISRTIHLRSQRAAIASVKAKP